MLEAPANPVATATSCCRTIRNSAAALSRRSGPTLRSTDVAALAKASFCLRKLAAPFPAPKMLSLPALLMRLLPRSFKFRHGTISACSLSVLKHSFLHAFTCRGYFRVPVPVAGHTFKELNTKIDAVLEANKDIEKSAPCPRVKAFWYNHTEIIFFKVSTWRKAGELRQFRYLLDREGRRERGKFRPFPPADQWTRLGFGYTHDAFGKLSKGNKRSVSPRSSTTTCSIALLWFLKFSTCNPNTENNYDNSVAYWIENVEGKEGKFTAFPPSDKWTRMGFGYDRDAFGKLSKDEKKAKQAICDPKTYYYDMDKRAFEKSNGKNAHTVEHTEFDYSGARCGDEEEYRKDPFIQDTVLRVSGNFSEIRMIQTYQMHSLRSYQSANDPEQWYAIFNQRNP
ncbi:hypothetical protein L596_022664 [Steinernema carpocapsae]|nr:hypothetical protein L596_022664 [Steinernema carpocapsae]